VATSRPSLTLRLYGAGGAFSRHYGTTCSELRLRDGQRWLIDCGRQAPDQLHAAGVSWHEIDGQIITHVHGDHVFGLEDFAFSRYYHGDPAVGVAAVREGGPRPRLLCHSAVREEVWLTLAQVFRYVPDLPTPDGGTLETYFECIDARRIDPPRDNPWSAAEHFVSGNLRLTAHDTLHVPSKPSTSLEIAVGEDESDDRVAWWSGDSTVHADLLTALEPRATIIFHDCTFVEYPGQVHGSFARLEALPAAVRRKIVLMHHEDDLEAHRAHAEALGFRIALPGHVYDLDAGVLVES
jgi:ribonuclease BN (tRNA processing enzyme)